MKIRIHNKLIVESIPFFRINGIIISEEDDAKFIFLPGYKKAIIRIDEGKKEELLWKDSDFRIHLAYSKIDNRKWIERTEWQELR